MGRAHASDAQGHRLDRGDHRLHVQRQNRRGQAQQKAERIVLQGNTNADGDSVPEYSLSEVTFPAKIFYILGASGLCKSSGEGRRQIQGGAVKLGGEKITDVNLTVDSADELAGKVLQVGKKKFIRLVE